MRLTLDMQSRFAYLTYKAALYYNAPAGCTLAHFFLQSPAWQELAKACQSLGLDVAVERGEKSLLRARIATPKSDVELTS